MISPFLIIGLGGSGGKTLRAMHEALLRKLQVAGWPLKRLPECWQFISIDRTYYQKQENFYSPLLPPDDYLGLLPTGTFTTDMLQSALFNKLNSNLKLKSFGGWVPPEANVPITTGVGEGSVRSVGRELALLQLQKIVIKIRDKYNKLSNTKALNELKEVKKLLKISTEGEIEIPTALIFTSLAGRWGSEMFIDVAEILKLINPQFENRTNLFVYGPEVFSSQENVGYAIFAKSLATTSELISCLWADEPGTGSFELFQQAGLTPRKHSSIGPKYSFLIGATNDSGISYKEMNQVFKNTGESISSLITSEKNLIITSFITDSIFAYSSNELIIRDSTRLKSNGVQHQYQPLSAIGFSRVSLGLDRFTDYLAEGCTRLVIEKLLWPKYYLFEDSNPKTPTELIEIESQLIFPDYLKNTGLDNVYQAHEVNNSLIPVGQDIRIETLVTKILANATLNLIQTELPSNQMISSIYNSFREMQKSFEDEETKYLFNQTKIWVEEIQDKIIHATSLVTARSGLQVTQHVIQKLREVVVKQAHKELLVTVQEENVKRTLLPQILLEKIPSESTISKPDEITQYLKPVLKDFIISSLRASRMSLAAELLIDLDSNLLAQLEKTVKNKELKLQENVEAFQVSDEPPIYSSFTNFKSGNTPDKFNESVVEKLLIPTCTYPELTEKLFKSSVVEEKRINWLEHLAERVTLGTSLDEDGDNESPNLFIVESRWIPQKKEVRKCDEPQQKASFSLLTDPMEYFYRSRNWLLGPKTTKAKLGAFLKQDLVSFLTPSDSNEKIERRKKFIEAFVTALEASEPLVNINTALSALVHSNIDPKARYLNMSLIPFTSNSDCEDLYHECKSALMKANIWNDHFESNFKFTEGIQDIEFLSFLQKPMNPMVFDSLMKPVGKFWDNCTQKPSTMHGFWTKRRSRPLQEFVPAAPEVINEMIIGWFVSGLLGQREITIDKLNAIKIDIWYAIDQKFVSFPFPLLPIENKDRQTITLQYLPLILESLILAFLKCNEFNSLDPLKAYWRIIDLGKDINILHDWIVDAVLEEGAPIPIKSISGSQHDTFESRKQKILDTLNSTQNIYTFHFEFIEETNEISQVTKAFEMRDQIQSALNFLIKYVQELSSTQTGT